ncbi:hypothetical protein QVD17_17584 [Tagetes erecta]|uniref:Uncharacterized protein n=1 Tax=Tagetes erecta TaxID=13708 RepID=A0AAD8KSI5_TARER|nr:hypothetical protein QVD17_17584 [Tagetes erecta]
MTSDGKWGTSTIEFGSLNREHVVVDLSYKISKLLLKNFIRYGQKPCNLTKANLRTINKPKYRQQILTCASSSAHRSRC